LIISLKSPLMEVGRVKVAEFVIDSPGSKNLCLPSMSAGTDV